MVSAYSGKVRVLPREVLGVRNRGLRLARKSRSTLSWLTPATSIELERVPNKLLKPSMDCPICGNPFLDGMAICAFLSSFLR